MDPSARDSITGRGSMRIEQIARTDIVLPRPRAVRDVNADEGESVMAPPRGLDGSVWRSDAALQGPFNRATRIDVVDYWTSGWV